MNSEEQVTLKVREKTSDEAGIYESEKQRSSGKDAAIGGRG